MIKKEDKKIKTKITEIIKQEKKELMKHYKWVTICVKMRIDSKVKKSYLKKKTTTTARNNKKIKQ